MGGCSDSLRWIFKLYGREDSPVFFQAEYYLSTTKNYRFLSIPSIQVTYLIKDVQDRGFWGVEGFILRFPTILYIIFCRYMLIYICIHADLQIQILLFLYDMTLPQTVSILAVPSTKLHHTPEPHYHLCSFVIQSIYKNLPQSGIMPCEDWSSACRTLNPSNRESLDILVSLITFRILSQL